MTCDAVINSSFFPAPPPLSLSQKVYTTCRLFRQNNVRTFTTQNIKNDVGNNKINVASSEIYWYVVSVNMGVGMDNR